MALIPALLFQVVSLQVVLFQVVLFQTIVTLRNRSSLLLDIGKDSRLLLVIPYQVAYQAVS